MRRRFESALWRNLRATICLLLACTAASFMGKRSLHAQATASVTDQWQGPVQARLPARVLIRFESKPGTPPLHAVVFLLDRENSDWPHATSNFNMQNGELSFTIANLDIGFTGKLSPGGAWTGTWTEHGLATPLTLTHATGDAAWSVPVVQVKNMAASADPTFELATIKPADPKATDKGFQTSGQRLRAVNESLLAIVSFAYAIHPNQIHGAPGWFTAERWEIEGYPDVPGSPNLAQMRAMYRKLLADRFALKLDRRTEDMPVYTLQVASGGPKLTRSLGDPDGQPDSTGSWTSTLNDVRYTNMNMDEFVNDLAYGEDRPIVNDTHLSGRYDFRLRWTSADAEAVSQSAGADASPVLFTAVREQLGLSLKGVRAPAILYVVTHLEQPSEN